jgi:undecaprenyl-diphosphatase
VQLAHTFLDAVSTTASFTTTAAGSSSESLPIWKAIVLGLVEGVTEYLPVSSTGHLLVVGRLIGLGDVSGTDKTALDGYSVIIQFGAIAAVLLISWRRVLSVLNGLIGRDEVGRRLLIALTVAFIPAAVIGKGGDSIISENLLQPWPIAAAWIIGGIVMLAVWPRLKDRKGFALEQITPKHAVLIGCAQVAALWPGTSRSFVTILAALVVGMSLAAAVEFSFLLGLLTLTAASAYTALTDGSVVVDTYGLGAPFVGILVAAVSAFVAVKFMVATLNKGGLAPYGWYRIAAGLVTGLLIMTNVIS